MDALNWRKASYSAGNGGGCVEAADRDRVIMVRDTTDRQGPMMTIDADQWRAFVEELKASLQRARPDRLVGSRNLRHRAI